jgi:hypothetical protein
MMKKLAPLETSRLKMMKKLAPLEKKPSWSHLKRKLKKFGFETPNVLNSVDIFRLVSMLRVYRSQKRIQKIGYDLDLKNRSRLEEQT